MVGGIKAMNVLEHIAVPLSKFINRPDGEDELRAFVKGYSCPLNPDVENFLTHTAINNQRIGISRTNLVYAITDAGRVLVGYYSLALQVLDLDRITSKSLRKKITGFKRENKLGAAVYLIGQMGKNFHNGANKLISGQEIFLLAMQDILKAQQIVGGRIVVVECKNDDKLRKFYEETLGFQLIDTADDESMLKYMTMISAYQ